MDLGLFACKGNVRVVLPEWVVMIVVCGTGFIAMIIGIFSIQRCCHKHRKKANSIIKVLSESPIVRHEYEVERSSAVIGSKSIPLPIEMDNAAITEQESSIDMYPDEEKYDGAADFKKEIICSSCKAIRGLKGTPNIGPKIRRSSSVYSRQSRSSSINAASFNEWNSTHVTKKPMSSKKTLSDDLFGDDNGIAGDLISQI